MTTPARRCLGLTAHKKVDTLSSTPASPAARPDWRSTPTSTRSTPSGPVRMRTRCSTTAVNGSSCAANLRRGCMVAPCRCWPSIRRSPPTCGFGKVRNCCWCATSAPMRRNVVAAAPPLLQGRWVMSMLAVCSKWPDRSQAISPGRIGCCLHRRPPGLALGAGPGHEFRQIGQHGRTLSGPPQAVQEQATGAAADAHRRWDHPTTGGANTDLRSGCPNTEFMSPDVAKSLTDSARRGTFERLKGV